MDGAMGTELMARGLNLPLPLWSAESNLTDPDVVQSVHQDYVNAGADIIGTNTFRTTTWTYRKAGFTPKRAAERAKSSLMIGGFGKIRQSKDHGRIDHNH